MIAVAVGLLVLAALGALYRIVVGPTLADRIIALDLALVSLMSAIAIDAANRRETSSLVLIVVIAIVGFTATVSAARFVEVDASPEPADRRGGG